MMSIFRRRRRNAHFVWSPSVDFSNRRVAAALMTFSAN